MKPHRGVQCIRIKPTGNRSASIQKLKRKHTLQKVYTASGERESLAKIFRSMGTTHAIAAKTDVAWTFVKGECCIPSITCVWYWL